MGEPVRDLPKDPNFEDLFPKYKADNLADAYRAITICGLWSWMREYTPEEGKGFSWSKHPNLDRIDAAMERLDGHSGGSYAETMRYMEFIAKKGWDAFVLEARTNNIRRAEFKPPSLRGMETPSS